MINSLPIGGCRNDVRYEIFSSSISEYSAVLVVLLSNEFSRLFVAETIARRCPS